MSVTQFILANMYGLCNKMYSLLFDDVSEVTCAELQVVKGVKGCVIRTSLAFKDYMQCLHLDESMEHIQKQSGACLMMFILLSRAKSLYLHLMINITFWIMYIPFLMVMS